jgi:hypothetical protein
MFKLWKVNIFDSKVVETKGSNHIIDILYLLFLNINLYNIKN